MTRHLSKRRVEAGVVTFAEYMRLAAELDTAERARSGGNPSGVYGRDLRGGAFDDVIYHDLLSQTCYARWSDVGLAALIRVLLEHAPLAQAERILGTIEQEIDEVRYQKQHGHHPSDDVAISRCSVCRAAAKQEARVTEPRIEYDDEDVRERIRTMRAELERQRLTIFEQMKELDRRHLAASDYRDRWMAASSNAMALREQLDDVAANASALREQLDLVTRERDAARNLARQLARRIDELKATNTN